jgi:flagellar P-ring protein precursor FlgI
MDGEAIQFELSTSDFTTARRVADAINKEIGSPVAQALDGRVVSVRAPATADERIGFLARVENLSIENVAPSARVIINARTGSVVMNQMVSIDPCAVAHGNLAVTVNMTPVVSQPNAFGAGQTVQAEKADITIRQDGGQLTLVNAPRLDDVVKALNSLGATPQDLLAILQAMKSAGALKAELEII